MIEAPLPASRLRLVEDPLGLDAADRPTLAEVERVWREACRQPVPDYQGVTLRRLVLGRL